MDNETDDILGLSDEEFLKMDPSSFEVKDDGGDPNDKKDPATGEGAGGKEASADDNHKATDEGKDKTEGSETNLDDIDDEEAIAAEAKRKEGLSPEELAAETAAASKVDDKAKPNTTELSDADYVNIGKQIMTEFKANGSTIKVKNVEDAIQLMQMGANYHKKMAGLKPSLKTLKLLENNDLLDPEKLNYLIDLSQKKPEAITQLLKDSQMDPMSIDLTDKSEYVPQNRSVSDTEILLDEVLDSISGSPSYTRTLTVLGDEWDVDSRTMLARTPAVIRTINDHIESGIYDQVKRAVDYERSLGKLAGVNDYEAYQKVGSYMHENGLFVDATGRSIKDTNPKPAPADSRDTSKADAEAAARAERKKAASPSRGGKVADDAKADYNPLSMSDEDFIKINKLHI